MTFALDAQPLRPAAETVSQTADAQRVFPSGLPAGPRERALASSAVLLSAALFVAAIPFAKVPLAKV